MELSSVQEIFPGGISEIYSFCEAPVNIFSPFPNFSPLFSVENHKHFHFLRLLSNQGVKG